jgi:hypothetical protein
VPASLNRLLIPLCGMSGCLMLQAQAHKVAPDKTITFEVTGATAAYSLDAFVAEATADDGNVSITGNHPGATRAVVVTPAGVQTFDVLVPMPPPYYPPGFVMPAGAAEAAESGYWEGRYYSSPAEIQNQFDFFKANADDSTHVHLVETDLIGSMDPGQARVALSSATYEVVTPGRDITLFDKYLDESQLTLNGSIVRGFHITDDNWFVHAGYTSVATFEGLFLPVQPELVVGGGYRYAPTENSSITGSYYHFQIPASDLLGRSGNVGDLRYKYSPRENFWFTVDLGISHGVGGAGRLLYKTARDNITSLARYMPEQFASLGANNLRGLHTDFSWTRHVTKKFETAVTFYNNNLVLPNLREATISGAVNLRYQLARRWAVTGGVNASRFEITTPPALTIRNFTLPAGLAFQSKHFGATGEYQFAVIPGHDSGGQQFRSSVRSGWGAFTFSGYGERDTDAPTLNFIFSQVAGLQQALNQQGIQATTVQQVDQLLSDDAFLIAAGYVKGASVNLVPVRTQAGGSATWSSRGLRRTQLSYSFLYNDNQALQGSSENLAHTLSYSQSITRSDNVALSCSVVGTRNPGQSTEYSPVCFVAWRHQFQHVPYFVIPERRGTISGKIFRDDQSKGEWGPDLRPMPEVEVVLDDRRRTLTLVDGSYRFAGVPRGKHKVAAMYHSRDPFFFTTPSDQEADEDATVNFGIGFSLSGLGGQVLNDAGQGIAGITVAILGRGLKRSAATEADGSYFVSSLVAGEYDVQPDEDSLPAGYAMGVGIEPQHVIVGATSPGRAAFSVRAFRSISGRVLSYDPEAGQYIPVIRSRVTLHEPGLTAVTDPMGRYLFRDLAAGSYTISVESEAQGPSRTVRLGSQPVDLSDVDFQLSARHAPEIPAIAPHDEATRLDPLSPAPAAVDVPVNLSEHLTPPSAPATLPKAQPAAVRARSPSAEAQRHNIRGRQLTAAGQYREAITELTEALRIASDFALAWNARGFAFVMLRDWGAALRDLDQAILLNPAYRNAYEIRATARKASGDVAGAAADLKRSQQLSH